MTHLSRTYILRNGKPVVCRDFIKWATFMGSIDRHVGDTKISKARVSTVFMGVNLSRRRKPMLWETMVFGPKAVNHLQYRYDSHDAAKNGHVEACRYVRGVLRTSSQSSRRPRARTRSTSAGKKR